MIYMHIRIKPVDVSASVSLQRTFFTSIEESRLLMRLRLFLYIEHVPYTAIEGSSLVICQCLFVV